MLSYDPYADRVAVLLAMPDCRDDPVALQTCQMFLAMFPCKESPSFIALSQPRESENV